MEIATRPERLAEAIRRRLRASPIPLNAYWMLVPQNREVYAEALEDEFQSEPVVVLVIRDSRFTNPNSLLDEFVALIEEKGRECKAAFANMQERCAFVLLSRTELSVPQISSPVRLPDWFPVLGGQLIELVIEDLTWLADAPLVAPELKTAELCEMLYGLERVLTARIERVHSADTRRTNRLLDVIRRGESESVATILEIARGHQESVTTAEAFRPSRRDGQAIVARLWGAVQHTEPDRVRSISRALADALDLPEKIADPWHEAVISVLGRPTEGEGSERLRFSRNILFTMAAACQLVTAAAHSDDYAHYPVALLRSISFDLRRAMRDCTTTLERL